MRATPPSLPDVGRHALERHHRHRARVLGDAGLGGVDDVHDHAALEHLGQARLEPQGSRPRVASSTLLPLAPPGCRLPRAQARIASAERSMSSSRRGPVRDRDPHGVQVVPARAAPSSRSPRAARARPPPRVKRAAVRARRLEADQHLVEDDFVEDAHVDAGRAPARSRSAMRVARRQQRSTRSATPSPAEAAQRGVDGEAARAPRELRRPVLGVALGRRRTGPGRPRGRVIDALCAAGSRTIAMPES